MPSPLNNYKIVDRHTGLEYPFAGLRVVGAVLERNLDEAGDRLELSLARGLESGPQLPLDHRLDLVDGEGATRFSGWLLTPELRAGGSLQRHRYVLAGPQWWLQRITYLQGGWNFATDFESADGDLETARHGRVILHQRTDFTPATIPEQLADALAWAQDQGAPVSFALGGMPELRPPEEEYTDLTTWEALERMMTWLPHWHWRWEYAGSTQPRLRFVEGGSVRVLPVGHCTELQAGQRRDELLGRLDLQFVQPHPQLVSDGADGLARLDWLERVDQASTAPGGGPVPGRLRATRYLRGALRQVVFNEELAEYVEQDLLAAEEAPDTDLAEILHQAYSRVAMGWRAVLEQADVDWSWQPGSRLQVTGMHPGWTAGTESPHAGLIRTVRHTLELGRTEILAGPAARLPLETLIRRLRGAPPPLSFPERFSGQSSRVKSGFGSDLATPSRIRIYGCADGQPVYYLFRPGTVNGPYPV